MTKKKRDSTIKSFQVIDLVSFKEENYYTQREWDRVVGYGKVPDKYNIEKKQWLKKV
tara:strand:+ start:155 stop:325 length:171 start_codon:yes stop_codon:yes gene_type:complete